MNYIDVTICQLFALLLFVHLFFLIGTRKKRNDIADVAWGLGFVLLAVVGTIHNPNTKTIIVLVLLMFWGFRLARHIFNRFRSHKEEDMRYQEFRKAWGSRQVLGAYFKVYLLQGFSLILVAMPILVLARFSDNSFSFINMIGVALWLFGFVFEVVADKQLKDFVKDKKPGQIMKNGLWSYSRHPNYFGEAVIWWGIFLISWGTPYFYIGLIGPITITLLLRFVSGVPMAEARYNDNPEFIEYKKNTPAFIPNFFK